MTKRCFARRTSALGSFLARGLALTLALGLTACGSDDDTEDEPGPAPGDATWTAGGYTVTAFSVTDGCLDGAADVVAIPGSDSDNAATREFGNPLPFLAADALPGSITIDLVPPFSAVSATLVQDATSGVLSWDPKPTNTGVDMGMLEQTWAGCTADFEFGASWTPTGGTGDTPLFFEGSIDFTVTGTNEDAGCPVFTNPPPCTVTMQARALLEN